MSQFKRLSYINYTRLCICVCKFTSKSLQKYFSCIKCNSNKMSCCSNSASCTLHWYCQRWWRREFCSVEKLVLVFVFSRCSRHYCCISRNCGPLHPRCRGRVCCCFCRICSRYAMALSMFHWWAGCYCCCCAACL